MAGPQAAGTPGKFTTGSTMRHVVTMTATGSVGLVAVFVVDALNLFYISLLGVEELAAAIGFASTLLFFMTSIGIGLSIAASALVSRALGRGDREAAARFGGVSMVYMGLSVAAVSLAAWPFTEILLYGVGARGETLRLATRFMQIVLPSSPLIALGMCAAAILRGVGDARRAMFVTLSSGLAAAVLDPLLIFGFGLGLDGAAISTVLCRIVMIAVGIWGARHVHRLMAVPDGAALLASARPFFAIGLPAVLTGIATPIGNTYVTWEIASFGDQAVAGWAIIGRVLPIAFAAVFALSGSVGPIFGQNLGARRYDRLTMTLRDSMIFVVVYVLTVWALLALLAEQIALVFGATGDSRAVILFFCYFAAGSFLFNGAMFVANAAFNNLGFATWSTFFNWGRSTLGVVPFVWAGAVWWGVEGAIAGWAAGAVIFGIASVWVAFRVVRRIADGAPPPDQGIPAPPPAANSPFSTGKAATLG
jgi:putative MATE family efflux protein